VQLRCRVLEGDGLLEGIPYVKDVRVQLFKVIDIIVVAILHSERVQSSFPLSLNGRNAAT